MPMIETTAGANVYYDLAGSGPPLLLRSGTGHDHTFWSGQLPFFTPKFTVITIDNRGVGRTTVQNHDYSLADMADNAAAVLDAESISTAHVMGFSQGGHIAQEVTLRHAQKVESLGIHHSWARMCPRLRDFQTLRKILAKKTTAIAWFGSVY
jgi:3-oxoadipate enol-lactonase